MFNKTSFSESLILKVHREDIQRDSLVYSTSNQFKFNLLQQYFFTKFIKKVFCIKKVGKVQRAEYDWKRPAKRVEYGF